MSKIVAFGFAATATQWQKVTGTDRRQIARRMQKLGWSADEAVGTPVGSERGSFDNFRIDDIKAGIEANGGVSVAETNAVNQTSQSFGSDSVTVTEETPSGEPVGAGANEAPRGYQNGFMYR